MCVCMRGGDMAKRTTYCPRIKMTTVITITLLFECLTCDKFTKLNTLHASSLLILRSVNSPHVLEEEAEAQ